MTVDYTRYVTGYRLTHTLSGFTVVQPTISFDARGRLVDTPRLLVLGPFIGGFGAGAFGSAPFGA